jgi:hypothetical protein
MIEVKTKKGRVSPDQKRWHDALRRNHYSVYVVRSAEEAKEGIESYLALL